MIYFALIAGTYIATIFYGFSLETYPPKIYEVVVGSIVIVLRFLFSGNSAGVLLLKCFSIEAVLFLIYKGISDN